MEIVFLSIVIFLFILAVFDLSVGVSNDAVNFLNSAIGSGAASFKRVLIVAGIGVFLGAAMSNGMMDIARNGIFHPEYFSFYEIICIFMAVMVTDIILLDIFNTLGLPTSTTVSMVFELLGAAFVVALIKMSGAEGPGIGELLNTGKALSIVIGIFLSVAIAFVCGTVVQFAARTIFKFNYRSGLKWKIGIFGGLCITAIVYFLLIKGAKELTFMTPAVKEWIHGHTPVIICGCLIFFTVLMQLLHWLHVNVLKIIVLTGTFALAMAFAGNDLVNFIGVPLSGLASYQDFAANGAGDANAFMMHSLTGSADTPIYFLIGAGAIMVVSLATSSKVRNVTRTAIGLSSQQSGDEMFGSSRIARRLVRWTIDIVERVRRATPAPVRRWFARRFDTDGMIIEHEAAFDLVRGSVNLVLAAALIAAGTSLKLPLSTTFVTFMVAMGTSLADKAWARESAVFRITGVISVIGGWFLTAGVAFIGAGIIVCAMYFGGHWAMIALAALTLFIIIRSNRRFNRRKAAESSGDALFQTIISTGDPEKIWPMLEIYITGHQLKFMTLASEAYASIVGAFESEDARILSKIDSKLSKEKSVLKNARRKETLCLRMLPRREAIERNPWFYVSNNCCMSVLYNLKRITEVCKEHTDNNFMPLPKALTTEYDTMTGRVVTLLNDTVEMLHTGDTDTVEILRSRCDDLKNDLSTAYHRAHRHLTYGDESNLAVVYVYINMLQESRELVSSVRKYMRGITKLRNPEYDSRRANQQPVATTETALTGKNC